MTSSLLQRLGIALPIIQGPDDGLGHPCPGCCRVGCRWAGHAELRHALARRHGRAAAAVRQQTDRPFGMNLFVQATPNPDGPPCRQRWNAWRRCTPSWACSPSAPAMVRRLCRPVRGAGGPAPGGGKLHLRHSGRRSRWPCLHATAAWWWAQPPPWPRRAWAQVGPMSCAPAALKPGPPGHVPGRFHGKPGRHPGAGAAVRGRRQTSR